MKISKINYNIILPTFDSDTSQKSLSITISITPKSLKTRENWDQTSDSRAAPHCHMFVVVFLLDPTKASTFDLDNDLIGQYTPAPMPWWPKPILRRPPGNTLGRPNQFPTCPWPPCITLHHTYIRAVYGIIDALIWKKRILESPMRGGSSGRYEPWWRPRLETKMGIG